MSILQDYQKHEKYISRKKILAIDEYLKINNYLSYDKIIYCKNEWEKFEKWYNDKYGKSTKSNS